MNISRSFWITLAGTLLLLLLVNSDIFQKEQQLAEGTVVRVALAPVDPRSLMQGDYMALRYALETPIREALTDDERGQELDGFAWIRLDKNQLAHFVAIDRGEAAPEGALRVQFRQRNHAIKLASNAWFFQEGQAERFDKAEFGEFRLGQNGSLLLAALLDENYRRL
ncbi:GDYXXLXY domain-containing protein [Shewanella khirikhana]|uniref:Membrane-anchored protein n=1 Tax=Shewanella khirikhana TaxID=1965282 RepID=A0ABN5TU98_9GAMM|nr:GDYXXLXY domain-containing protein [Shewanella khirikhana]AZQ10253.1 hypothetical protein STH12_01117 [Shewanella khirikhana]